MALSRYPLIRLLIDCIYVDSEDSRLTALSRIVVQGTVKWFNGVKGFGFVEQGDKDLFFSEVEGTVAAGDVVEFEVDEGPRVPTAVKVRMVGMVAKEHSTVLEPILRVIAEDVFQSISSFRFNPKKDNGRLEIGTHLHSQRREFYYDNLQSKSWRDIQAEMKEDKNSNPLQVIRICAGRRCSRPAARGGFYDNRFCIYCQNTDE